jgi:hypothetical protein
MRRRAGVSGQGRLGVEAIPARRAGSWTRLGRGASGGGEEAVGS